LKTKRKSPKKAKKNCRNKLSNFNKKKFCKRKIIFKKMEQKINSLWDKQQQNWIKEILSKSGTELKEISDKNGTKNIF
jgi:hypothetical protein